MRVTNGISFGCSLFLPVGTVNCAQTLKAVERLNAPAPGVDGDIFALEFVDQSGSTTVVALWNATGGCGVHNGSVPLLIHSPARCFEIRSIVGEEVGEVCRTEAGGGVVVEGVSEAVLYLRPTL
jgi:hypothetical protein